MANIITELLYAVAWLAEVNLFFICGFNVIILILMKLSVIKARDVQPHLRRPLTEEQFWSLFALSVVLAYIGFTGPVSSSILKYF